MIRIVALNEEENSQEDEQVDITATKEAQETIVESEYLRALKLKSEGKYEIALSLLSQLLETKVLTETTDKKNSKISVIRYSCHKNIATIYEDNKSYDMALQHFILAFQIDDNDIFTMNRFGQLALKLNYLELAEKAFSICLEKNTYHASAAYGLLKTQCQSNNVLDVCRIAIGLIRQYPSHLKANKVLSQIASQFKYLIPFFEKMFGPFPSNLVIYKTETDEDAFEKEIRSQDEPSQIDPDLSKLSLKTLSWLSVGKYIIEIYNYLKKPNHNFFMTINFNSIFCDKKNVPSNNFSPQNCVSSIDQVTINSKCHTASFTADIQQNHIENKFSEPIPLAEHIQEEEICNEDSDSYSKSEGNDVCKPKQRRRCSDLHHLEQWGWHKTRRRKKRQECSEIETNLNGILRKIFSKFMQSSFDDSWPFGNAVCRNNKSLNNRDTRCDACKNACTLGVFDEQTKLEFDMFLKNLKAKSFDLLSLIYKWLKHFSKLWNRRLPEQLKIVYIDIYALYIEHFECLTWNTLTVNGFTSNFYINQLFLEIELSKYNTEKGLELSTLWKPTFNKLMIMSGYGLVAINSEFCDHQVRLAYMEYLSFYIDNNLDEGLKCLNNIWDIIKNQEDDFILHIPNLGDDCITKDLISKKKLNIEREISLKIVPTLFLNQKWTEVCRIISNNILNEKTNVKCDKWIFNLKTQIEILLNALWNNGDHQDCLLWSEKFVHFIICQYLTETRNSSRQKCWAESINFILSYVEALLLNEGFNVLDCLDEKEDRLVQNIIRLLSYHFDEPFDKSNNTIDYFFIKRPWVILHQIIIREENCYPTIIKSKDDSLNDDNIPYSFLILFTAHEFLGKFQCCTNDNGDFLNYILDAVAPNLRAPLYDACRDSVCEYVEQVTYCLFGYPPKKARSRHLEEHDARPTILTWHKSIQVFDLYRPDCLPEFNSYKLESISADMEQLLLKILPFIPKELEPNDEVNKISKFIRGETDIQPEDHLCKLPFKISSIYYLLADYYFKSRDFSKAIKYYMLDLAGCLDRFDSWAGIALSKASKIETKLNDVLSIDLKSILMECEDTIRCFERCININRRQTLLWIEYGSFTYTIHSLCSRYLKQRSKKESIDMFLFVEKQKKTMLSISFNCFSMAASLLNTPSIIIEDGQSHEEKWLCQYMLGKIAEKRKEEPKIYLNFYLMAAHYLYESNATYPIKINHSNPTTLSVEALEIFYRTNSAVIKYLEHEKKVNRDIGELFKSVLKNLSNSPFAFNKAKIYGNSFTSLKRKNPEQIEQYDNSKLSLEDDLTKFQKDEPHNKKESTTATITLTSSEASSSTNSDSSLSDSDSAESNDSSQESESRKYSKNTHFTNQELEHIYKMIIRNLEECVSRFPEHYKSIYRLVYHYMNAPENSYNLDRCEQLLLGQYKTILGNQINGLFHERKNNNIFNGIWRIPSSEIDRPGSFSAHLGKCIAILIQLLFKNQNHKLLIEIGFQLYKTPDPDKRYINDDERLELFHLSFTYGSQILQCNLEKLLRNRNDSDTMDLLIDIYKIYKKCTKYSNQKETLFSQLLIEVYKFYIADKVNAMPTFVNFLDLAIKLCVQEIGSRKSLDKLNSSYLLSQKNASDSILNFNDIGDPFNTSPCRSFQIPGLTSRIQRNRSLEIKGALESLNSVQNMEVDLSNGKPPLAAISSILPNEILTNLIQSSSQFPSEAEYQKLVNECFKRLIENASQDHHDSTKSIQCMLPKASRESIKSAQYENTFSIENIPGIINSKLQPIEENSVRQLNLDLTSARASVADLTISNKNRKSWQTLSEIPFQSPGSSKIISNNELSLITHEPSIEEPMLRYFTKTMPACHIPQIAISRNPSNERESHVTRDTLQPQTPNSSDISNFERDMLTESLGESEIMSAAVAMKYSALKSTACVAQESSTKTLQQKLAERQKVSQFYENAKNDKQNPKVDVIILD